MDGPRNDRFRGLGNTPAREMPSLRLSYQRAFNALSTRLPTLQKSDLGVQTHGPGGCLILSTRFQRAFNATQCFFNATADGRAHKGPPMHTYSCAPVSKKRRKMTNKQNTHNIYIYIYYFIYIYYIYIICNIYRYIHTICYITYNI